MNDIYAIIDLGSNSVRMSITRVDKDAGYKMVMQSKEMVRLAQKMTIDGLLHEEAILRTIDTLNLFKQIIKSYGANKIIAVATAAVRNATNSEDFIKLVKKETGISFEIISGESECYLDYLGVINTIDIKDCVIVDTGGGSTEIVLVMDRKIINSVSVPFGAINLSEEFPNGMKKEMLRFLKKELGKISWLKNGKGLDIVALGGSARVIAKIQKKRIGDITEGLHNYTIKREDVDNIYKMVYDTPLKERKNIPGASRERADIILGGITPLYTILNIIKPQNFVTSGNGLREGIFFNHFLPATVNAVVVDDILQHCIYNLANVFKVNTFHGSNVAWMALSLFDQLSTLHKLPEDYKMVLYVASYLHDIGLYVDFYNHHKHGFYLIMSNQINGITFRQKVLCAFLAGMHRALDLKEDIMKYSPVLSSFDIAAVEKLVTLLKIADKLDAGEAGDANAIYCTINENIVDIDVESDTAMHYEILAAQKNERQFEKVFGCKLCIRQL